MLKYLIIVSIVFTGCIKYETEFEKKHKDELDKYYGIIHINTRSNIKNKLICEIDIADINKNTETIKTHVPINENVYHKLGKYKIVNIFIYDNNNNLYQDSNAGNYKYDLIVNKNTSMDLYIDINNKGKFVNKIEIR